MKNDPFQRYSTKQTHFLKGEGEGHSLERIDGRINTIVKGNPRMRLLRWVSIAAAAILLLVVGKVFIFDQGAGGMGQAYFEPYPNYAEPVLRGAEQGKSPYTAYDEQNFEEAVALFGNRGLAVLDSFYLAISLCGVGDWDSALPLLSAHTLISQEFVSARQWYYALALIETGGTDAGQVQLRQLADGDSEFSETAAELLRALK